MRDPWARIKDEQRLEDIIDNAIDQLTDELNQLREIVRNLVRYDDECLGRQKRTLQLHEVIAQARTVLVKHGVKARKA